MCDLPTRGEACSPHYLTTGATPRRHAAPRDLPDALPGDPRPYSLGVRHDPCLPVLAAGSWRRLLAEITSQDRVAARYALLRTVPDPAPAILFDASQVRVHFTLRVCGLSPFDAFLPVVNHEKLGTKEDTWEHRPSRGGPRL